MHYLTLGDITKREFESKTVRPKNTLLRSLKHRRWPSIHLVSSYLRVKRGWMLDKSPCKWSLSPEILLLYFSWNNFSGITALRPYPTSMALVLSILSKTKRSIFDRQWQCQSQCLCSFHNHSLSNSAESCNDQAIESQWIYGLQVLDQTSDWLWTVCKRYSNAIDFWSRYWQTNTRLLF